MPGFIKPQLATLKSRAPNGEQWLHEIKYDGYRVQVHLNRGRKKVFTRNGLDWTKRFTEIAGALAVSGEAIIDGEVVVVHEGRTNFSELQAELAAGRQGRLVYYRQHPAPARSTWVRSEVAGLNFARDPFTTRSKSVSSEPGGTVK